MTIAESRLRRPPSAAHAADRSRDLGPASEESRREPPDWLRRRRRRQRRLRRTVVVAILAVLAGTAIARTNEDPGTVLAAGVKEAGSVGRIVDGRAAGSNERSASKGSAAKGSASEGSGASGSSGGPSVPGSAAPADRTVPAPADAATAGSAPAPVPSPAMAHADSDDPPAAEATPDPSAAPVPSAAAGTISMVEIPTGPVKETGRTVFYGIDMEDGLPVAGGDFASVVHAVLIDPRGWQTKDDVRFVPVSRAERAAGAPVDVRVTLASPALTAKLCAPLDTSVQQVSCWNGARAVLNLARWVRGAQTYGTDLASYRDYLVSHEVGHGLGHLHVNCPGAGRPAPVMVQQTKDLEGCTAWPWPTSP